MATEVLEQAALGTIPEVAVDQPPAPVVLPEISGDIAEPTALGAVVDRVREVAAFPNTFVLKAITKWQYRETGTAQAVLDRLGPVGDALQSAGNYVERLGVEHSINIARLVSGGVRTVLTAAGYIAPSIAGNSVLDVVADAVHTSSTAVSETLDHTHQHITISEVASVHTVTTTGLEDHAGIVHNTEVQLVGYTQTATDNHDLTRVAGSDNAWSGRPDNLYDWAREDLEASLRKDGVPEDQIKHLIHDDRNIQPILDAYEKQNADALKSRHGNPAGWLYDDESYKTGDAKNASDQVAAGIAQKLGIEPKEPDPGAGGDTGGNGDGGNGGDGGDQGDGGAGKDPSNPGGGAQPSAGASASAPAVQPSGPAVQPTAPPIDPHTSGAPSTHPTPPHTGATSAAPVVDPPNQAGAAQDERAIVTMPWGKRYYADYVLEVAGVITLEVIGASTLINIARKANERRRNPGLRIKNAGLDMEEQAVLAHQLVGVGGESDDNREKNYELRGRTRDRVHPRAPTGPYSTMAGMLDQLRQEAIAWAALPPAERERRSAEEDAYYEARRRADADRTPAERAEALRYSHVLRADMYETTSRTGKKRGHWYLVPELPPYEPPTANDEAVEGEIV